MTAALDSSLTGTNYSSLLSIATIYSQFASFCVDNRLRQGATFVSVKMAKFEIIFNSLSYKANRFRASWPASVQ